MKTASKLFPILFSLLSLVVAQENYAPCTLPASLLSNANTWDGSFAGLNICGRLVVRQQNCYNCMSPDPLRDRACICDKFSFRYDVIGGFAGNGANCAGMADRFKTYANTFCGVVLDYPDAPTAPGVGSAVPVLTSSAVLAPPAVTTTLAQPLTLTTTRAVYTADTRTAYQVTVPASNAIQPTATLAVQQTSHSRKITFSVLPVAIVLSILFTILI
ncbi:hypothetical protein HK098_002710 [Nowakowskiella sp. JEL0407]|nr:hypothetical protein HK098_002710 [Nowakowskiella sp. JEL0407]